MITRDADLDAYLNRIGYSGPATPTLDTLAAIHYLHPRAIAFENLNPLLGWPVSLDTESLLAKLVSGGRGGYCFEHNLLLSACLTRLGFRVTWLAARVLLNRPEGAAAPRSHMVLLVEVDGRQYIADVGFGGLTLTAPLRFEFAVVQTTPHEPFRLTRGDGALIAQAEISGAWRSLYKFDLQAQVLPDYEVSSWYLSHHPASPFVTTLMAARPDRDRRYALRNNELAIHHLAGGTDRRLLTSAGELRTALEELFLLTLPDSPDLDAALRRVSSASESGHLVI
jgi:N-hydroxyarylamine O-acetyltransferase